MSVAAEENVTFDVYDPAEFINSKEAVIAFLEEAIAENDPEFLLRTIGHIARSKGMALLARELNLDGSVLHKSFPPDGNPYFLTVVKVPDNLGLRIRLERKIA